MISILIDGMSALVYMLSENFLNKISFLWREAYLWVF